MEPYEIGKTYTFNGKDYVYRGGDPDLRTSWRWIPTTGQVGQQLKGTARELAQGATFGFADELEAALRPGKSREDIEQDIAEYREAGGASIVPQMVGAAAVPGGVATKLGTKLFSRFNALQRIMGLGAVGAAEGAVAGAGTAQPGERGRGAAVGAGWGGTLGLGLPAVAGAVGAGARAARNVANPNMAREAQMATAGVLRPALKPGQKFTDLLVNPGDVAADLTLEGQIAGGRALRDRPENLGDIYRTLTGRQRQLPSEIGQAADAMTGTPAGRSRVQQLEELRAQRQATSSQMYQDAYKAGVVNDKKVLDTIAEIAGDEDGKKVLASVRRRFRLGDDAPLTAEHLDILVRELDGLVSGAYRSGRPPGVLRDMRDELRDRMLDVVPGYKEARETYRALRAAEKVAEDARKWKSTWSPQDIKYQMKGWSQAQREEFAFGVASDLEAEMAKRLSKDSPQSAFNWLHAMRPRLKEVFGGAADDFYKEVARLERQAETFKEAGRGVRGAARPRRGEMDTQIATAVGYASNRMLGAAFRTAIQSMVRSPTQQRAFSREIAELLYQRSPQEAMRILEEAMPFLEMVRRRQAGSQAFLAGMGGQAGGTMTGN